jgi:hypothetical protein
MRIAMMVLSSQRGYTIVTRSDWRKDVKANRAGSAQQPQQMNQLGRTNLLKVSLPRYFQGRSSSSYCSGPGRCITAVSLTHFSLIGTSVLLSLKVH